MRGLAAGEAARLSSICSLVFFARGYFSHGAWREWPGHEISGSFPEHSRNRGPQCRPSLYHELPLTAQCTFSPLVNFPRDGWEGQEFEHYTYPLGNALATVGSVGSVGLHEPAAHLYGLYVGLGVYRAQVVPQASLDPVYHLIHVHPHGELPGLAGPGVPIGHCYWASVGIVCIGWPDCVWIVGLCACAGLGWPRSICGLGGLGSLGLGLSSSGRLGLSSPSSLGLAVLAGSPAGSGL